MGLLQSFAAPKRRLVSAIHLALEQQAGIGPISQKPELLTMGLSYDDASDSAMILPAAVRR
jgi:hypothetical protein